MNDERSAFSHGVYLLDEFNSWNCDVPEVLGSEADLRETTSRLFALYSLEEQVFELEFHEASYLVLPNNFLGTVFKKSILDVEHVDGSSIRRDQHVVERRRKADLLEVATPVASVTDCFEAQVLKLAKLICYDLKH